jgi:glycosyltransferase involved in cell wall biosynthesis
MTGSKIRVLHVLDSFDLGGAQEVVANLLACADRDKFELEVASMHRHGVYSDRFRALGAPIHSLSLHKLLPLYVPNLLALLRRGRFDIVHTHLTASNLIAKPLAASVHTPVLINHDHANDASRRDRRLICAADRWANRFSSHICAVSQSTRRFLVEEEHIGPAKVTVVHNGIDLQRFVPGRISREEARRPLGLPTEGFCLAGVGRLTPQKNFVLLLETAARLREHRSDFFVALAGTGPLESALRRQCAELGLNEAVHFLGHIEDTSRLYPALDLLVMPSLFEGLPMVLLEAMAMRVPVVASAVDGVAEIVDNDREGVLLSGWDAGNFCRGIHALLDDAPRRHRLTDAASDKVQRQFSRESMTRNIEDIYKKCLTAAPGGPRMRPAS